MSEENNTKLTTLVIPTQTKVELTLALHEIINLAPHGVISKKTVSTIRQLQSSLQKKQPLKSRKNVTTSLKL